jgi:copper chaperone
MTTITYSVPEISCGHCRAAITAEVSKVGGVRSVSVDLDQRTVTVVGDALDGSALVGAIDAAGYEVAS